MSLKRDGVEWQIKHGTRRKKRKEGLTPWSWLTAWRCHEGMNSWYALCNNRHVDAHSTSYVCFGFINPGMMQSQLQCLSSTNRCRPQGLIQHHGHNVEWSTNQLSIRPVLAPAFWQVFFFEENSPVCRQKKGENSVSPWCLYLLNLSVRVVLQGQ